MLHVQVIVVGKLKEAYLRDACAEYSKRIGRYATLTLLELPEARLSEQPQEKEIEKALSQEGTAILKACRGYCIALCIEGTQLSSEAFSQKLQDAGIQGNGTVTLLIGSSHGLANEVKTHADFQLSMSKMTFPHQLARVMLLEQIYRAFQIAGGGKYHK